MPSSRKFFYSRQPYFSQVRNPPISICCVVFGVVCFIFGVFAISRRVPAYGCSNSARRSVSVVWEVGSGGGTSRPLDEDPVVGSEVKRRRVMGFVGIQTGFGSVGRRKSLRKTWLPSDREGLQRLEESTGLAFRFVIGKTRDRSKMSVLSKEVAEYDDFMLLDLDEEYKNLPHKTLAFFKAAYQLFDADFYVKADDDIYLRPDRLSLLLAKDRSDPRTYLGCMKKGPVFTDPKLKWYEPHSYLLGNEYFLHAYGPIYALSADVVASVVALRNNSFRMFSNEDVTIGSWMLAMNVNHEDNRALCSPDCTDSSIAVWDIPKCSGLCNPEVQLLTLHRMERCSGVSPLVSNG